MKTEFIIPTILLASAIVSVPLGELTAIIGTDMAMILGLGGITGCMGLTLLNHNSIQAIGLIIGFGISFGFVFISITPLALGMLSANHAGLGTGLYFGGAGTGTALVSILMKQPNIHPIAGFLLSELAFLIAGLCIYFSKKYYVRVSSQSE